jgi:hypothetical protein
LAFLDEDDAREPAGPEPSRRYGGDGPGQRPYLARRLVGLGIAVLIIILLVLGIRGCLNARKERGFENYQRDLVAIVNEANQLSDNFFKRLQEPSGSGLEFESALSTDRSTAEGLLERVQGLDTPDELASEQQELELAFTLRRDGIGGVADQIQGALGENPNEAQEAIADYMRYFLASDVLYGRARTGIDDELKAQDITVQEKLPDAAFLRSDEWLSEDFVSENLSGAQAGAAGNCPQGEICGLELIQTEVGGTILDPTVPNTVAGGGPYEIIISAQNQGTTEATEVPISFEVSGGPNEIDGNGTIAKIRPGLTKTGTIEIRPDPEAGASLTLDVSVGPVPGEQLTDNNESSYTVTFE